MSLANDIAMRLRNRHKIDSVSALNSIAELLGDSIESIFVLPVQELIEAYENYVKQEEDESLRAHNVQLEAQQAAEDAEEYAVYEHLDAVAKADESARVVLENEFPGKFTAVTKQSNESWVKAVLKRFGELIRADRRTEGFPNPKGLSKANFCAKLTVHIPAMRSHHSEP